MTQEALKQMNLALETMEAAGKRIDELKAENKALKEALAQPEQEPVAWMVKGDLYKTQQFHLEGGAYANQIPLYTTPPQRTEQEPMVDDFFKMIADRNPKPFSSLQRPRIVFPTMLRKMWSGSEVQAWLDENVNKEKNT